MDLTLKAHLKFTQFATCFRGEKEKETVVKRKIKRVFGIKAWRERDKA